MRMHTATIATAQRLGDVEEYYFSRKLKEIARRREAGEDILNLGIGNPDLPPPPAAVSALTQNLSQPGAHGYQSYRGIPTWREGIRDWYARVYSVALDDSEILPLAGSKEGITHLCLATLNPGDAVLYPNPGYPAYAAAAQLAEATALPYPMPAPEEAGTSWVDRIADVCTDAQVKLLFVNTPHMPTGQVLQRGQLESLLAFAKTRGITVVSDNAYGYYHPDGPQSLLALPGAREVAVELNSLSKSHHMPGWRLGCLVGRADVVEAALRVKSNLDSGQFRPLQAAAAAAVATEMSWHAEQLTVNASRRKLGTQLLKKLGCDVPADQHGLFVWGRIRSAGDAPAVGTSERFCDELLDRTGLFCPPGTVFGGAGEGYVRLSLCSPASTLHEAARRCGFQLDER